MSDITKTLGYGGSAVIDGEQVLITSGAYSITYTPTWLQMIATPPISSQAANRVMHADGGNSYTGSLSFDLTSQVMSMFTTSRMFQRWYTFDVGITDANLSFVMSNCKATSVSLTGATGGLVSASVAFLAKTAFAVGSVTNGFIRDDDAVGYWWSGAKSGMKVKSWTFTMTQDVQPVYGNLTGATSQEPFYLKAGLVEYSLEVESYTPPSAGNSDVVYVCTSSFTIKGMPMEKGFQYNGVTDLGTYRYVFASGVSSAPFQSDEGVLT